MKYLFAIFLGLVQGLTEFLPVSSSGHLLLFKHLFHMDTDMFGLSFDIALHLATLAAVCIAYRKKIWELLKKPFQRYVLLIIIATIPAVIVGVLFDDVIESISQSGGFLGIAFLITATVFFVTEKFSYGHRKQDKLLIRDAIIIGAAQGIAVVPGISRSGSTLAAGLFSGVEKKTAMDFSFIMSIPVILGSAVLGVKDIIQEPANFDVACVLIGMVAAGISGYVAVSFMLKFFRKHGLKAFAVYLTVIGVLVLLDQLFFQKFFTAFMFWNVG